MPAKDPAKKTSKMTSTVSSKSSIKGSASGLKIDVLDIKGKVSESMTLPSEIFKAKTNTSLMSQSVRVYLANQRKGTAKTKDRGEINRTTKKAWQQKGTGRARHGSKRAPIFVGGGVAFGPRPKDFSLKISKKMKTLALFSALSGKLKNKEIKIVTGLEKIDPKTKIAAQVLQSLELQKKKVLLVLPKMGKDSDNIYKAARNIKEVSILGANTLNTYKVLDNAGILIMKDAIEVIKNTFLRK
jgi:large subunit ribosomal protein L4